jgi:transposase
LGILESSELLFDGSGEAERFYRQLEAPALIGLEASGNSQWFEDLLLRLGHEVWIGDAAQIRASYVRKQKTDRRDAAHILKLLLENRFPRLWRPDAAQRDLRQLLIHRHKLVGIRARVKNGLQHLMLNRGVQMKRKLWSQAGQQALCALPLEGWAAKRRNDLLQLLKVLDGHIRELDQAAEIAAKQDAKAVLLMTQPGVGPITALAFVLTMGDVSRFQRSIDAKAEFEYLYDKPYEDKKTVRVAGPFTVESLSPHRVLGVDDNEELIDPLEENTAEYGAKQSFPQMILENLKTSGVQQAHKDDRITFTALTPWPGELVCAEGRYIEGSPESGAEKRAAIFIGPEFGTVTRPDLVEAAREAGDADFDVLIACAFNYEARATEFNKLGRIPVLKARMNADLHMADDLKNTGKGNLFVIFGEPDIDVLPAEDGKVRVKVNGVDVFHPNTGEVRSDGADGIACWFIDTDYNEESFFVRHAYFLGANDPYTALKTTLKAEINEEAWETLHSDTSRPFDKPRSGRIAVKVINHLGDEVMKVFRVN